MGKVKWLAFGHGVSISQVYQLDLYSSTNSVRLDQTPGYEKPHDPNTSFSSASAEQEELHRLVGTAHWGLSEVENNGFLTNFQIIFAPHPQELSPWKPRSSGDFSSSLVEECLGNDVGASQNHALLFCFFSETMLYVLILCMFACTVLKFNCNRKHNT